MKHFKTLLVVATLGLPNIAMANGEVCDVTQAACYLSKKQHTGTAFLGELAKTDHSKMACIITAVYGRTEQVLYKGPYLGDGNVHQSLIITSQKRGAGDFKQYQDAKYPVQYLCFKRGSLIAYLESLPENQRSGAKITLCNGTEPGDGYHHEINYENIVSLITTGHAKGYMRLMSNADAKVVKPQYQRDDYKRRVHGR